MIQTIANKNKKHTVLAMLLLFYFQIIIMPLHAAIHVNDNYCYTNSYSNSSNNNLPKASKSISSKSLNSLVQQTKNNSKAIVALTNLLQSNAQSPLKVSIGGPSAPEASSFKAVGSNNLVNLFTGDFSYSIPLLDVGGYPVNLFYSAGIGMEQEASWVGLGWNINPGTVSRNMRGVPDDFNGEDKLIQTQKVKPNRTWGGEVGIDGEVIGFKKPKVNLSLGVSYNNYLGAAFDLGAGVSLTIPIMESVKDEKGVTIKDTSKVSPLSPNLGVGVKLSSRSGLTFSPSLSSNIPLKNGKDNIGIGLSTSYNSRTGIKALNIGLTDSRNYTATHKDKYGKEHNSTSSIGVGGDVSIDFARPSYIPSLRMPMQYGNYSGQLEFGGGMFGLRGAAHGQGYYSESKVPAELETVSKPLVGFMYSEKANDNPNAVMDFQRLNDGVVTPNTPILSAPMYNYDVFSIQGEGTGGSIRAYRGDLGFMKDNETRSKDENISIGLDIAPVGHYGINWNVIKTPTRAGGWEDGNNYLKSAMQFKPKKANSSFENVYFRSPGESTVTNPQLLERIGRDNLVRFQLSGSNATPRLEAKLDMFDKKMPINFIGNQSVSDADLQQRDKRTQVTTMLTAAEASEIGLEKNIRNYTGGFDAVNNIQYNTIERTNDFRKPHHISEINVLEQTGMRYVYGLPVYNTVQKDITFSIANTANPSTGIALFNNNEPSLNSPHMSNNSRLDGYVMGQETPAYASSFLLTGLLSPDYVDVTGNGITEDDLGNAVKFDYQKSADKHRWRTPRNNTNSNTAHFNEGLKSIEKDNKANISYGEREVWYLNAIESKAMVAIFKTGTRQDAKGVNSELDGSANSGEEANKKLEKIDLYTKAEIKAKGYANAIPIKTVNFEYSYNLCKGTPDNATGAGKLTLERVYFTYYGRTRTNKDKYIFNYNYSAATAATDNPDYAYQSSDKWGTYKPPTTNPAGLTNAEFPYTSTNKAANDAYAGAWSLKRILLPSGGQMEVQYEADDYGFVQNRKACDMFSIYGFGKNTNYTDDNGLYEKSFFIPEILSTDNDYVYVKLPQPLESTTTAMQKQEILEKYLQNLGADEQLAFKLFLDVPKGNENLNVYAKFDEYGLCTNSTSKDIIYFKLRKVDGKSPLARAAIGFLVESLPGQAFPNSEMEVNSIKDFLGVIVNMLMDIKSAFKGVDNQMRSQGKARTVGLIKSFVRLADPDKVKYGGGVRVKRVLVRDNWDKMTNKYNSTYGQDYDYTTTDKLLGKDVTISSGVASYETGIGSEENPFREIVAISNKMPLATAQYGSIEMPMLDGLYPSAGVGYSKVTVRSIHRKETHANLSLRSAIGKQVTEYYTAKEYPTFSSYTTMDSKEYHFNSFFNIFYKEITDRKVTTQGFLVETNDMHGKMKSQMAFSQSDEKTPLSYSYHTYKNTGRNGLNDKVDFVNNATGGTVTQGNMGIDMELMTDVREHKVQTNGKNGQLQTDFFTFVPFPFFVLPKLFLKTVTENRYRSATCTKLINYHAIDDSVIVMDKGSIISTKTIAYDAETGTPIVTKTANEFNDPIYNVSYPAHWAYSGTGLAYKNIDRQFTGVNFRDGKITNPEINQNEVFESGDELYITKQENVNTATIPAPVINGSVGFICTPRAGSNGNGGACFDKIIRLAFNFPNPTPQNLKFYLGTITQASGAFNGSGQGAGGVTFPSNISILDNDIYEINIPAGVTNYITSANGIYGTNGYYNSPLSCCNGYTNSTTFFIDRIILKVVSPLYFSSNLTCSTPGITLINQNPVVTSTNTPILPCLSSSPNVTKLWAYDSTKNSTALIVPNKNFVFIDSAGNLFNKSNVTCRIVRSGKRNNLDLTVSGATCMENPIQNGKLIINNADKIVSASAVEYKEKWQVDNEVIKKYKLVQPTIIPNSNLVINGNFEQGNTGFTSFLNGGNYSVNSVAYGYNTNCRDHTTGHSNMLIIDGAGGQGGQFGGYSSECYRSNLITVQPNTNYELIMWVQSLCSYNAPYLHIMINNNDLMVHSTSTTCGWYKKSIIWNSGNSTTASISVVDEDTRTGGNDFALDDISFIKTIVDCPLAYEIEDCAGYLEKKINPYIKGLIGNIKPYRSYTYYSNRTEPSTANITAIRKNGYLNNFTNYWNFNTANNLVPDASNTKWVWNSELTKVNSKGQELETKNALNIFTAAQYGFAKNQATAVANNSRVNEMFAESFEDQGFSEGININNSLNCAKKQIDFNGMPNSSIVNTQALGFNAHTGKKILQVNTTTGINIQLNNVKDNFNLKLNSELNGTLTDYGYNIDFGNGTSSSSGNYDEIYAENWLYSQADEINNENRVWEINSYYDIKRTGVYWLTSNDSYITQGKNYHVGDDCSTTPMLYHPPNGSVIFNSVVFEIYDVNNNLLSTVPAGGSISFEKGIYKVVKKVYATVNLEPYFVNSYYSCGGGQGAGSNGILDENVGTVMPVIFKQNISKVCPSDDIVRKYKSLTFQNGCSFTKPIPATDSMLNPIFSPTPNKKMHFSAWVREGCTTTPCTKLNYADSKVQIVFSDGSNASITPTGSIIEGWQKVEGDFDIPIGATTMDMKFINNGTTPNFWDDIRVHPYNANMKSYAYDPLTLRLSAELDENNYATFYEYDEEGQLIRVKEETAQGIKTIKETRSAKQQVITAVVD